MKTKFIAVLAASAALLVSAMTAQADTLVEVYPTGLYPDDVKNVQVAIDSFGDGVDGVVVLKSHSENGVETAFNFGTDPDPLQRGGVSPNASWSGALEIRGETCRDTHTVIQGGYRPIYTNRRDTISVNNIEFRGAWGSAIFISETTGADIHDNVILDTVGNLTDTVVRPIRVTSTAAGSRTEITGNVNVLRNRIEGASSWFSQGIASFSTNAQFLVADNTVTGTNVGIVLGYYQQAAQVVRNSFTVEVPAPDFYSAGIELFPGTDATASANVSFNHISVDNAGRGGFANGIDLITFGEAISGDVINSLVYGNTIELKGASNGIFLFNYEGTHSLSDNIIARNTVMGSVVDGIFLEMATGANGRMTNNHIAGNKLSSMKPSAATSHIWLGPQTRDTLCAAEAGNIVVDHGVNNVIVTMGKGHMPRQGDSRPGHVTPQQTPRIAQFGTE